MLLNNKHYYNLPPQERKNLWKHYKKVYPNMGYTDMVKHFNGEVENYQMGGKTTSSPDVTEAKDYMKDWYNSPMYKNIYQSQLKDLGMSNPKRIERVTNRAVNLANQSNFDVNPTVVKDLGKYGEGSYDNKGARIIKLDKNFVENNPKLVNSLYTHELAHDNLMTAKDEEYISKNTPKFNSNLYNEQQYNILTDPEEVRSQIHSIRQLGKKNKIYDPLTQPFKKEYLDKINESYKQGTKESEDYNQVQRLRKFYSDDQITDMLNKVTKTKSTDQSVYAKHGGIIKTHQFGGRTDYFNSDVKKFVDGGKTKPSFEEYYKTIPQEKNDTSNYDLRRAFKELPYSQLQKFAQGKDHLPDTYKLPNHPTFSDESIYFNPKTKKYAGHWTETDSSWNYIPYNPAIKDTIIEKKAKQ